MHIIAVLGYGGCSSRACLRKTYAWAPYTWEFPKQANMDSYRGKSLKSLSTLKYLSCNNQSQLTINLMDSIDSVISFFFLLYLLLNKIENWKLVIFRFLFSEMSHWKPKPVKYFSITGSFQIYSNIFRKLKTKCDWFSIFFGWLKNENEVNYPKYNFKLGTES